MTHSQSEANTVPHEVFNPFEQEHVTARKQAKTVCLQLNALPVHHTKARSVLYQSLFAQVSSAFIEPGFFCDYGKNIYIGEQFYANHGCIMLDAAPIHIGDRVLLGPNVHLYATTHPLDAVERASGKQYVAPITLEDDCWIGGNTVVMPGVTIGAGAVIGAGSVVTHSIAAGKVAFGNPCKEIRNVAEMPLQVASTAVKTEPQKAQQQNVQQQNVQRREHIQRQQTPATTTNIMAWSSGIAFLLKFWRVNFLSISGNLENSATASSISLEEKIIRSKFRGFYFTQWFKEAAKTLRSIVRQRCYKLCYPF